MRSFLLAMSLLFLQIVGSTAGAFGAGLAGVSLGAAGITGSAMETPLSGVPGNLAPEGMAVRALAIRDAESRVAAAARSDQDVKSNTTLREKVPGTDGAVSVSVPKNPSQAIKPAVNAAHDLVSAIASIPRTIVNALTGS